MAIVEKEAEHTKLTSAEYVKLVDACPKSCTNDQSNEVDRNRGTPKCGNSDAAEWMQSSCGTAQCSAYQASRL